MKKLAGFLLVLIVLGIGASSAHAANLNGWAWSETFGWISFNSGDSGAGGGPYAVNVNLSANILGYAWSEYAGWISFNAADVPAACSASPQAHIDTTTGAVTGWAYALVYAGSPNGCIELSGTNHTSPDGSGNGGVTYDKSSGVFKGYAWGGDTTNKAGLGWIQFNASASPVRCMGVECGYTGTGITASCSPSSATTLSAPGNVNFTATASGCSGSCEYNWSAGVGAWSGTNSTSISYSSGSTPGPTLVVRNAGDTSGASNTTASPNCGSVNIAGADMRIGKNIAGAIAGGTTLTVKQTNPFALYWNITLSNDYSCAPSVSPDPNITAWNSPKWKGRSLNEVDNGDGTKTWTGNTGDYPTPNTLAAGTLADPAPVGLYRFNIVCTSSATPTPNPTHASSVELKVNSSTEREI